MNVILILIVVSLTIALVFLGSFIWSVKSGQFDDTCTPSMRLLADEEANPFSKEQKPTVGLAEASEPVPTSDTFSNSTKATKNP